MSQHMNVLTIRQLIQQNSACLLRLGHESESHWEGCEGTGGHLVCNYGEDCLGGHQSVMDKGNGACSLSWVKEVATSIRIKIYALIKNACYCF